MVTATPAQAYLNERQSQFPAPRTASGTDRIVDHFAALRPGLPPELVALFDNGTLAIGEIGIRHPEVVTTTLDAGGYAIEFSTEMLAYAETIVRALSGRFAEGTDGPKALEMARVQNLLREAVRTYRREGHWLWSAFRPHFEDAAITVTPWLIQLRGDLLDCIARFWLAHELGHVAINAGIRPSTPDTHEVDADRHGLNFFLPTMVQAYEVRVPIAAAGLAIRLFVSLERFGVQFAKDVYPPQSKRLELLREALLPLADSAQRCDELSTVLVSLLDQFDALDDALDEKHVKTPIAVDRLRINFLSRLIEVQRGNLSVDGFIHDLQFFAGLAPRADIATSLSVICEYYWLWADTAGVYFRDLAVTSIYDHQHLIGMSRALRAIAAKLPDADRTLLPEQYR